MEITIEFIDAFTDKPFSGNPAAVCLFDSPRSDEWMQALANEINLSETAFLLRRGDGFGLRWFTPLAEVELCGHATLASAYMLYHKGILQPDETARFHTLSGLLTAGLREERIEMDFPAEPVFEAIPPDGLYEALGVSALFTGTNRMDFLVEVENEEIVRNAVPDFGRLKNIPSRGFILTSRSNGRPYDFVSRCFFPALGVNEDPVTGSAHCALAPYWAGKLGKQALMAYQASRRSGELHLRHEGERVVLGGQAVSVMTAKMPV